MLKQGSGGQCLYSGSVGGLIPFMTSHDLICPKYHNPADFIIEVASGEFGEECTTQMLTTVATRKKEVNHHSVLEQVHSDSNRELRDHNCYTASLTKQFAILLRRQLLTTYRDPMVTHLRLISHITVGLLFGGLNYQIGNDASKADQNVSFIFLCMLFLVREQAKF